MTDNWWPIGEHIPTNIRDFKSMSALAFEQFAVEVLKRYFSPYGVVIANTRPSKDGARDGEGGIRIGGEVPDDMLDLELKVWIEAKHHSKNVGPKTVGWHVCAALIEDVQKIIFVSSGGFTKSTKDKFERLAFRTGLRCSFVDGDGIIKVFRKIESEQTYSNTNTGEADDAPQLGVEEFIFSDTSTLPEFARPTRCIKQGEPVFIFVRTRLDLPVPQDGAKLSVRFSEAGSLPLPCLGDATLARVGPSEMLERVFVFHPSAPRRYRADEFLVQCSLNADLVLTASLASCSEILDVLPAMLPFVPTPSQSHVMASLTDSFNAWLQAGGIVARAIEAPAGQGKSRVLAKLRALWLDRGLQEIRLDGGTEVDEWTAFLQVFGQVLPVDRSSLDIVHSETLRDWLVNSGVDTELAKELSHAICAGTLERETLSFRMLGDLLGSLLSKSAPVVVLVEDLHKVTHGLVRLFRETILVLARRDVDVFMVFTSRYEPMGTAATSADAWKSERVLLLQDERVVTERIEAPSEIVCADLLRQVLPDLTTEDVRAVTEQVGRSPFNLSEVLHYLRGLGVIKWDDILCRDIVLDPTSLHERIYGTTLVDATSKRIDLLKGNQPQWAVEILDMAACLGREFSLAWCMRAATVVTDENEIDQFLATCMRENILNTTGRHQGADWRFDHDLVRFAALRSLIRDQRPRHLRISSRLLETFDPKAATPFQELSLLYQSGRGEAFVDDARSLGDTLLSSFRHADAADLLDTVACVLDPTREASESRHRLDDSFVLSPRPVVSGCNLASPPDALMLDVLEKRIVALTAVTSGSSPDLEADLTIAEMFAESRRDTMAKASFRSYWGQLLLERGREHEALDKYEDAEALFAKLPVAEASVKRADNLIRMGIAFRHLGQPEQSREALDQAVQIGQNTPELQIRRLANLGALYFYNNAAERRHYWQDAYELAKNVQYEHLRIHMALDLASLDILGDLWEAAADKVEDALDAATRHGLANSLLRSYVLRAAIDLHESEPVRAASLLTKSYQIAVAHSIDRRAWKINANMATAQEMLGDFEKAYLFDQRTVATLLNTTIDRRAGIPLGNIALRAGCSSLHQKLLSHLSVEHRELAVTLADAAGAKHCMGLFPAEHCKVVGGEYRYLIT